MPVESNYALERILALKQAAKQAAGGFGTGLKNQAMGLAQMLGNPLQTLGGALEGAHSMALNSRPAEQAMRQYLAQSLSSPSAMGQFAGENVGPGELVKALMGAKALGGIGAMTAYHGSPHKFDKFDSSKIGTGEGAQAYGHGLYFAEDPKVAGQYRRALSGRVAVEEAPPIPRFASGHEAMDFKSDLEMYLSIMNHSPDSDMVPFLRSKLDQKVSRWESSQSSKGGGSAVEDMNGLVNWYKTYGANATREKTKLDPGFTYNVDIPDEAINKMLDWDAPLSEQPESVRKALEPVVKRLRGRGNDVEKMTGGDIYDAYSKHDLTRPDGRSSAHKKTSEALRSLGIPGIRYLDAGSRIPPIQILKPSETVHGQWLVKRIPNGEVLYRGTDEAAARAAYDKAPKPTRNMVVFDDSILKILKRE